MSDTGATMGTAEIMDVMRMIPHRYPMLLVDRVIDMVKGERATGIKNVTINEPYFQGHFPTRPVMPGVMVVESMAQTAGILVVHTLGSDAEGKLVYFMSIDEARFRKPIVPGDQVMVHVFKERSRGNVWRFRAEAKVDGNLAAEATFAAMILDSK
ncbi:MAG: 3-hydroxyacyl-ACP dehydratase FabZ [Alphaproteobacteria bacterium]|jgi:3-hydroxyacyl-[acyl-carrier-protein] dehydratase|nr:3-hydroxyacyl-ACP dehydratase FabZ [Alphaproteobacteria bacterium]